MQSFACRYRVHASVTQSFDHRTTRAGKRNAEVLKTNLLKCSAVTITPQKERAHSKVTTQRETAPTDSNMNSNAGA